MQKTFANNVDVSGAVPADGMIAARSPSDFGTSASAALRYF